MPKLRTRGACQAESAEALKDTDTKTQNDNDIIMIRYGWLAWCPAAILPAWRNVVLTCRLLTTRNHRKLKKNQQVSMLWKATKAVLNISKWFDSNLTPNCQPHYLVFLSFLAGRWGSNHKWLPWPSAHHQPQDLPFTSFPAEFQHTCTQATNCVTMPTMMPASPWDSTWKICWKKSGKNGSYPYNPVLHVDTWRSCQKAC